MKHSYLKLFFFIYNWLWIIIKPFLRQNRRLKEGFHERTLLTFPSGTFDIWIQSASAGEAGLAKEVVQNLQFDVPIRLLLTSYTKQGLEILNSIPMNLQNITTYTAFFPFDQPSKISPLVKRLNLKLMVFIELEIWPALLYELKQNDCKTMVVNGRLTQKSLNYYILTPNLWKSLSPDTIISMSLKDQKRFKRLFPDSDIQYLPNLKFDTVLNNSKSASTDLSSLLPKTAPFIILGSVRKQEESEIINIIKSLINKNPAILIGLFPRHMQRIDFWKETLSSLGVNWCLRSEVKSQINNTSLILWDVFGELSKAYSLSNISFVGGSLVPLGGQNILEPLIYGSVPITGPYYSNFEWAAEALLKSGLLKVADTWQQVATAILNELESPSDKAILHQKIDTFFRLHSGGLLKTCSEIKKPMMYK